MNISFTCKQIDSLLKDLSSTGIQPIPELVLEMRTILRQIEKVETRSVTLSDWYWVCPNCDQKNGKEYNVCWRCKAKI